MYKYRSKTVLTVEYLDVKFADIGKGDVAVYVLKEIEAMVYQVIEPGQIARNIDAEGNGLHARILSECSKVKRILKETVVSRHPERYLQRFYQGHQSSLIRLIKLVEGGGATNTEPPLDANLLFLKTALYDLLAFLKTDVSHYFDKSVVAPLDWQFKILTSVSAGMTRLQEMSCRTYIDKELFSLATRPIEGLVRAATLEYTFVQLDYVELLQQKLLDFEPSVSDDALAKQELMNLLISVNYNSPGFICFCSKHIAARLAVTETLADRIDKASYYFKVVSQVDVVPGVMFDTSRPSAKEQILEWISAELEFLRQQRFLQLSCPPNDEMIRQDFKLNFNLSVSHLAYLFKAFIETGVIQNKNTSELARFLSKFVKTKKSEAISFDSFRIKFYNVESGTKDAVKKMLQSMLQYMNRN